MLAAEECLSRLPAYFREGTAERPVPETIQEVFGNVYLKHNTKFPLRIYVGACSQSGEAELWLFDSDIDFVPTPAHGVNLLAMPATEALFREGLEQERHIISQNKTTIQACNWLTTTLNEHVMLPGIDKTVGGKIQVAMIDHRGFCPVSSWVAEKDATDTFERITPKKGELTTLSPKTPPAKGISASTPIGIYQIVD